MNTIRYAGFLLLALRCLATTPARGQITFNFDWNNPAGGSYNQALNWTSVFGGIPDSASEVARFNLDSAYTVTIDNDFMVGGLVARDTGIVNLNFTTSMFLPRHIYRTESLDVNPTGGRTVTLRMNDGDVRVSGDMTVGGDTSNGQANLGINSTFASAATYVGKGANVLGSIAVGSRSTWSGSGPLVLGDQGDAQLDLEASFARNCFIACGPYFTTQASATHAGVTMANEASSNATASIRGIWNTGDLIVGNRGTAVVDLLATISLPPLSFPIYSAGSMTSNQAALGAEPGSMGTVNVTGIAGTPATTWNVLASLILGGNGGSQGGTGRLAVGTAGTVSVQETFRMWSGGTLAMGESGNLNISGAAMLDGRLEFTAANPQLGNTYQILSASGGVMGTFSQTVLPALGPDLAWDLDYNATNVMLTVVADNLPGDYNRDGIVNAADYTVWRDTRGSTTNLTADGSGNGTVDTADYNFWRARFGNTAGSGSASAVPEPAAIILCLAAIGLMHATDRGHRYVCRECNWE